MRLNHFISFVVMLALLLPSRLFADDRGVVLDSEKFLDKLEAALAGIK